MNRTIFPAALVLGISFIFTSRAEPPKDSETAAKLVGTWMIRPNEFEPAIILNGVYTFRPDGSFVTSGSVRFRGRHERVEGEGKWRVQKSVLIEEITKSSFPDAVPVGHVYRETVLGISDQECWLREDNGTEHFLTRYKP